VPEKLAVWGIALWGRYIALNQTLPCSPRILPAYSRDDRRAASSDIILLVPPQMDIFLAAQKQYLKRKSTSRTHTTSVSSVYYQKYLALAKLAELAY